MVSGNQPFKRSIEFCALVLLAGHPVLATEPFIEEAQLRGIDYVTNFDHQFGHGLAFADLDGDGDPDLVTLGRADGLVGIFENDGLGHFTDRSRGSGIPLVMHSSGVIAGDYDRDGDLDLYISCGIDIFTEPPAVTANFLLRNDGDFIFTDVTAEANVGDEGPGYGCAWAEYDNDGGLDVYVSNRVSQNRLYHNLGNDNHWLTVRLEGTFSNRSAVGARVQVTSGGLTLTKEVYAGSSAFSMDSKWLTFGLGGRAVVDEIRVRWPRGLVERFAGVRVNQSITLVEGTGTAINGTVGATCQ